MSAIAGTSIAARPRPDHRRPGPSAAAGLERSVGRIRLGVVADDGGRTRLSELYQGGAAKVRFPDVDAAGPLEAVLLNTAGGVTGGDHLRYEAKAGASARATITTQAAERVYRRSAGVARIESQLTLGPGASIDWLPQETIIFDRSALRRSLSADLAGDAYLLAAEAVVLGRTAMGETVRAVEVRDSWRIRRAGRLVFADGLRFDGDTSAIMAGGATGRGAIAIATLVLVAPDAERGLAAARGAIAGCLGEAGVSAWNGVLVARLLAGSGQALRMDLVRLVETLRGRTMPRVWNC